MPKEKKKNLKSGCLKIALIGFAIIVVLSFIGQKMSANAWEKERPLILASIESSIESGDYKKAISLIEPHQYKDDSDIKKLASKAESLRRQFIEDARKEKVVKLINNIKNLTGEEREKHLDKLLDIDPLTQEFPEEISAIRLKKEKLRAEAKAKKEALVKAEKEQQKQAQKEQIRLAMENKLAQFKWKYQVDEDKLTSKSSYTAWLRSINTVNFDFPYQGEQRGELLLRTHPQHGKDLILRVKKGQMLVRSYEDTSVKVVFDQGSPVTYKVVGPSDHGSTSLFFRDYHGFVARMLKAKTVKISCPFYQQGNVVFEFNVSDFDSKKYLAK